MKSHHVLKPLTVIALFSISVNSGAEVFSLIESKPISEVWLNPGFYSYHFQREKALNSNDFGLGGEYRYSTTSSATFGLFYNSVRLTSHYAGWYWQPIAVGPVRFGAVVGAMDGYPKMKNGDWFLAMIPTASFEYKNFGANIMYVPSYQDRLYGAISVQLKFKVFSPK